MNQTFRSNLQQTIFIIFQFWLNCWIVGCNCDFEWSFYSHPTVLICF